MTEQHPTATDPTTTPASSNCCGTATATAAEQPAAQPCCGTATEAGESGACCGAAAKAQAVTAGAGCC